MRVFPLSNWTEQDIWSYILLEQIQIVSLYYAKKRRVIVRGQNLIPVVDHDPLSSTGGTSSTGPAPLVQANSHPH